MPNRYQTAGEAQGLAEQDDEKEVARSVRLPKKLWRALENDAKRCKRSSVKQLEALLTKWYAIQNVELQFQDSLGASSSTTSPSPDAKNQTPSKSRRHRG